MLTKLERLDLSNNGFNGPIPASLGNLTNLMYLYLYNNSLQGPIPDELGNLDKLHSLELSHNNLSGAIPPQLGKLAQLRALSLHNNHLSGPIPPNVRSLPELYLVELYNNALSGSVFDTFATLKEFSYARVDNNNISGIIPVSGFGSWNVSNNAAVSALDFTSYKPRRRGLSMTVVIARGTAVVLTDQHISLICTNLLEVATDDGVYSGVSKNAKNMCLHPDALEVVLSVVGTFGVVFVVASIVLRIASRRRWIQGGAETTSMRREWRWGLYIWGCIASLLPFADLATDAIVLAGLWPNKLTWGLWVVLFFVLLPYVVSGVYVLRACLLPAGWVTTLHGVLSGREGRFIWWPAYKGEWIQELQPARVLSKAGMWWTFCLLGPLAPLAIPFSMVMVVFIDIIGFLGRAGIQVTTGRHVVSMDGYIQGRSFVESMLRSFPQAVVQTIIYFQPGPPFISGVYVSSASFIPSLVLSLSSIGVQFLMLEYEAFSREMGILKVICNEPAKILNDFHYTLKQEGQVTIREEVDTVEMVGKF